MEKALEEWVCWHRGQISSFHTKELAVYMGVSTRTIQRWMKEMTKPNSAQLQLIEQYLNEHK